MMDLIGVAHRQWNDGTVSRETYFLNMARLVQRGYNTSEVCSPLSGEIREEFIDFVVRYRLVRNIGDENFSEETWEGLIKFFNQDAQ